MKEYNALYKYFARDFSKGTFNRLFARCVVIEETVKSYHIRLIDLIQRRLPGETLWVRKKSVFRSFKNNSDNICDKYNIEVKDESCRACLQHCYRKVEIKEK